MGITIVVGAMLIILSIDYFAMPWIIDTFESLRQRHNEWKLENGP